MSLAQESTPPVDVEDKTRDLLAEHFVGCGSLSWYPVKESTAQNVSPTPDFLTARLPDGNLLVGYINVDVDEPIYYVGHDGAVRRISVRLPNGTAYLPDAPTRATRPEVWQTTSSTTGE